eukprot:jgi/Pico_ML_1/54944/g80.t1
MVRSIRQGVVLSTSTSSFPSSSPSSTGVKASSSTCFHRTFGNPSTYATMRSSASKRRIIFSASQASNVFLPITSTAARFLAVRTSRPSPSARTSSAFNLSTACGKFSREPPSFEPKHVKRMGMPAIAADVTTST